MELITSLVSSSVKASASETIMMTQQFIMKTTDGSLLGVMLISTPNNQSNGMYFTQTRAIKTVVLYYTPWARHSAMLHCLLSVIL